MELRRFTQVDAFYERVAPYLLAREAEHNLILGLCMDIKGHPERYRQQPYMAAVEQDGNVVLVGLMTPPYNLTLSLCAAEGAIERLADDLATFAPRPPGVSGAAEVCAVFARTWQARGFATAQQHMGLRIYKLSAVIPPRPVPGTMRRATEDDRALLVDWLGTFDHEAMGQVDRTLLDERVSAYLRSNVRGMYLWETGGRAVAMAGYSGPTPHSIRIVAVYTPPEYRRRGYASALVASLSQHLLDEGRKFCTLFTDLANPTSNHIYQAIGYEPVIDVEEWRFVD